MAFDVYVMGKFVGKLPTPKPAIDATPDQLRHALMVARAELEHVRMHLVRAASGQVSDPSWIRPRPLSTEQIRDETMVALEYARRGIEDIDRVLDDRPQEAVTMTDEQRRALTTGLSELPPVR